MADRDFILAPRTATVSIALEPVLNLLDSLQLLDAIAYQSGFSPWVEATAASMTPEERRFNTMLFSGFSHALTPEQGWESFPAYIEHVAGQDPVQFRQRALWMYRDAPDAVLVPPKAQMLGDLETFLGFFESLIALKASKHPEKDFSFDRDLYADLFAMFQDIPATLQQIVAYLQMMWDTYLEAEWTRVLPMLQESVAAFQQIDFGGLTTLEAVRVVVGRDLSTVYTEWAEHIMFIPSPHIGPYVYLINNPGIDWLIFGARLPEGTRISSPALSRSDLLVRLNALADDTRLRILELLTTDGELCAQDIMTALDLSQSSASRHLRQLTATGYLVERRREIAKCYSLNLDRVDDTLRALKQFMRMK